MSGRPDAQSPRLASRLAFLPVLFLLLAAPATSLLGQQPAAPAEPPSPFPLPAKLSATVSVINAPVGGIVRLRMTIDRWSTVAERKKLFEALQAKGTPGLVEAMEDIEMGYFQVEDNVRWPIRVATTWKAGNDTMVRLATNRPISISEGMNSTRSLDYPIGFVEFKLPPDGKNGEGKLLAAVSAQFDKDGKLEVKSLPSNTGPQQVHNVTLQKPKGN